MVVVSIHTNIFDFICLHPNGGKWNLVCKAQHIEKLYLAAQSVPVSMDGC